MRNYDNEIIAAVWELASVALEDARANCPVRTGRLKRSLTLSRGDGRESFKISSDVPYAAAVELGGRGRRPRLFLSGSVETARKSAAAVFAAFLGGGEL